MRTRRPGEPPPLVHDLTGRSGGGYASSIGALVGMSSLRAGTVALITRDHLRLLNRGRPSTVLGVHYALVSGERCDRERRRSKWLVVERRPEFCILQNPRRPQRFSLIQNATAVGSIDEMVAAVRANPNGRVPIVADATMAARRSGGNVTILAYETGHAVLAASPTAPALLLVRESRLPGWDVRVDGVPVDPVPAAGLYFAVPLDPGQHTVTLRFRAPGFRTGVIVALAWVVGATLWTGWARRCSLRAASRTVLRIAQRLALMIVAILLALAGLEIGLRIVGYEGASTRQPFRFSHEFGEISMDVLRRLMPFEDDGTRIYMRGQDVPYAKQPGVTRVLFVGDSDTAGSGVSLEQSYPMQFARRVDEAAPGTAEIVNFGVPGMSPVGEYAFFRRHLAPLRPDVVVLGLFMPNDLNFCLDDGQQHAADSATLRESYLHVRDRFALLHFLHLRLLAASGRSGLLTYEQARHDPALLPYALSHRGMHARRYDAGELLTYLVEDVPLTDAMWMAVENVFRRFQELAVTSDFQFVVVMLPAGSPVFGRLHIEGRPNILEEQNRFAGETLSEANFDVHKATRRVLDVCRRTGTLCIDPTPRMRGTPPERFYGLGDHHSAEMFALIGEEVFRHWDAHAQRFAEKTALRIDGRRRAR